MATIQTINIGASANDNTGDPLRTAFDKTNQNNTALNNDLATKAVQTTTQAALDLKAPLASPTITGTLTTVNDAVINSVKVGKGGGNIASNTVAGNGAGNDNVAGFKNTSVGQNASNKNQNGSQNSSFGYESMFNNQGNNNFSGGYLSGYSNIFGGENTFAGAEAGFNNSGVTASSNSFFGYKSGFANTVFFNISCLGANSNASASNQVNLGDTGVTSLRCNAPSITSLSDSRDKTDILEISEGLDFVSKLKPVTFTWNQRDGGRVGIKSAGFIAQDLLELQNDSLIGENLDLVSNDNPDQLEARYANLMPIMIKAIQELKAEIELLKSK